jgi:hypothetical protein
MPVPANTVQTFTQRVIREDLSDTISDISPTETPFFSNMGDDKATNTLSTWQIDALAAPDGNNAQIEGDDADNQAQDTPTQVGNYQQIMRKVIGVAGTTEAVNFAGRKSEQARLLAKRSKEIKRDAETIMLSNQIGVVGSASVARRMAGLGAWVRTNVAAPLGAGGANPPAPTIVPLTARTDGTARAFTEALFKDAIQKCYTNGAEPTIAMVSVSNKAVASTFAGIATKTFYQSAVKESAIIGAADVYVSDYGTFSIMANRFQRTRDAWLLDMSFVKKCYLRRFKVEDLAKTGDSMKKMLIGEVTLKVQNEAALGLIPDLT